MTRKFLIYLVALILLSSAVFGANSWTVPKSAFTFDDADLSGSTSVDRAGYQNGTLVNTPTTGVAGIINEAYDFASGSQECVNLTDTSKYEGWTGISISAWVRVDDLTAHRPIWSKWWDGVDRGTYLWANQALGKLSWRAGTDLQNDFDQADTNAISTGNWYHVVGVWGADDPVLRIYRNGSLQGSFGQAGNNLRTNTEFPEIGCDSTTPLWFDGAIDEVYFYNYSLNSTEVSWLFNNMTIDGWQPFAGGGGATTDINFTITDDWNSSSINSFNINLTWQNGTQETYLTTTGTITLINVSDTNTNINVTYWNMTDYFDKTLINEGITANTSNTVTTTTFQSQICFDGQAKVSNASLTPDNITIDATTHTSCFNLTADTHNVKAQLNGWYNQNQSFTTTPLQNTTLTVVNMSYANLTISAIDGTTNESLTSYDLTILSLNHSWSGESASGVTNHSFFLINGTYNVTIDMPGYAITTAQANVSVSGHTNYTFTLYKSNSVRIFILDEITNLPITENITVRWTSNLTTWENVTDTGELFIHNLTPDVYTLLFYGSNYSTRNYVITVGNLSTQVLNAYMISSTYSTIFTIKDIDTGSILDNVSITMYKQINSTWVTVESKYSDISGKAQFYYDPIAHYRFFLSNTGYEDYVFYLNPILFSEYDVFMTKSSVLNYSVDFDDISIIYSPTEFFNNQNHTFNFLISSPDGLLTTYSINLTYPGGSDSASGSNAIGEQLSVDVNLTNATVYDRVVLEFNYTTSLSGERTYTVNLPIISNYSAGTWLTNKDKTYGLGIFERMLIATIIIIFVVGIATMVGQSLPGVALGLFLYGFLVFIGFVPLWAILPSMLIGVLFLIWKSGGY